MHSLRNEAEELRQNGYSYKLIEEKLGISRSTLSYWFKDKPFYPNAEVLGRVKNGPRAAGVMKHNARVRDIEVQTRIGINEIGKLTKRDLWLLGLGIYLGEGAKTTEAIRISNADPDIIRLAIRWLKDICRLTDENFSIRLHIYPDNIEQECISYWQKVTCLPLGNFRKSSIDSRTNKQRAKNRRLPFGTAHVTVLSNGDPSKGRTLYRKINGWMKGALDQV